MILLRRRLEALFFALFVSSVIFIALYKWGKEPP